MMFSPPFGYSPFFRPYYSSQAWKHRQFIERKKQEKKEQKEKQKEWEEKERRKAEEAEKIQKNNQDFFDILGIHLYFDDILIICLLFFLYQEGVHDQSLFLCLILLLLS